MQETFNQIELQRKMYEVEHFYALWIASASK